MVAADLKRRIFLNSPVRRIVQGKSLVRVETDQHNIYGKRVIVAIPPTLAGRIEYDPLLPPLRDQLTQRMPQGTLMKFDAIYPTPFHASSGGVRSYSRTRSRYILASLSSG